MAEDTAQGEGYENKAYRGSDDDLVKDPSKIATRNGLPADQRLDIQEPANLEEDELEDMRCGLGSCKPDCLQVFNNPKAFLVWLCLFSFAQGFMVNGVNNVNTSTLERRFELSSSQAGLISSSYDISAAILSIPISYYGAHAHQPRMLTLAALVMAVGAFIMSVPHFGTGLYELKDSQSDECIIGTNTTLLCEDSSSGSRLSMWLGVFIIGMILNGIGGTTLYSVGIVFLDNSVSPRSFPLYQGFLYSTSTLGPAVGYLLGGYFVQSMYVDIDKVDMESITVSEDDPRFVGAWWLGFLASGFFLLIVVLLLMCYPRQLPASKKARLKRKDESHRSSSNSIASQEGFGKKWRDLPVALKILLTNPVYMCLNLSGACEGLIVSGIATFLPKFIQNQFVVSAGYAAMLAGAVSVPGAAGGQFVGGLVCKLAKLKVKQMLKLNIFVSLTAMCFCVTFLFRCSAPNFAGINTDYDNITESLQEVSLISECNDQCGCTTLSYEPICGVNNVQYFSPCHAGCQKTVLNDSLMFVNCSCVDQTSKSEVEASSGVCVVDCTYMYIFLPLMFITIFMVFMAAVPSLSATMRCIPESQRSFGIGVQWVFLRLLGSIPGPILMGAIYDSTCDIWQETCVGYGSCWIYSSLNLSIRTLILTMVVKAVSTFFFILAFVLYKPPPGDDQKNDKTAAVSASSRSTEKAEDAKAEDAKAEDAKAEDAKAEDAKAENAKTENAKTESEKDGFVNYGADLPTEQSEHCNPTEELTEL